MVSVDGLATALAAHPVVEHPALPGRTNHLPSGVAVPLRWGTNGLEALLTLRPATLRRHGGEVSFPGGRPDPGDVDLCATAARELEEELGVVQVAVLGRLSSMPVYTSDFRLTPWVFRLDDGPLRPSPDEVERVIVADLDAILSTPCLEGIVIPTPSTRIVMPVFRLDGHLVYGATALTLHELLGVVARADGRAVPPIEPGGLHFEDVLHRRARAIDPPGPA